MSERNVLEEICEEYMAGHVGKREMKNWQRELMPRKWWGNGAEEVRNCDGGLH